MTAVDPAALDAEIRERIAGQVAASVARRAARRQERDQLDARRAAGLRQRHAAKLARQAPAPSVPGGGHRAAAPVTPVSARNRGVPGEDEQARLRGCLGAALRRERAARRLTQRALAALAGCHPRTIERLEAGQLRPTTALVAALAHALAVPPGYAPAGRREAVDALRAELATAAGPSLVPSTPGGERRRRRRLRKARLAVSAVMVPVLRAQRGLPPQRQAARVVPADVAQAVRRYAR